MERSDDHKTSQALSGKQAILLVGGSADADIFVWEAMTVHVRVPSHMRENCFLTCEP
jgi:hypothetical protein